MFCRSLAIVAVCLSSVTFAEELDYHVTDPDLKVVRLDSSADDSFLSVRVDSEGRIFVGGRKTLHVYDLDKDGYYLPRRLLYEFPDHSWVNDIEVRGDDLYLVTVSAVYRLPNARVKREGLTIERLLWGVPNGHVHQCFHACAWGPEGDLYVSMGDPLWYYGDFARPDHWGHWTMYFKPVATEPGKPANAKGNQQPPPKTVEIAGKTWAAMPYNGVGSVFRIRPDGTDLRSYSRGLRNPCGLCFDKNWNLFTNDNDHEGLPSLYAPGRLLHVTEGSYFSWPRGWLQSKTPDRADILPTVNEEMGRAVPVLQTYYDEDYLPKFRNSLMVARWCRRQVTYFPLNPQGRTFTAKEHLLLEGRDQARPVGVCVGRGGRIFVTICYMAQNEGSPVYRSDLAVITRHDDSPTMPFASEDITKAELPQLLHSLEDRSWTKRRQAHEEMQRRGEPRSSPVIEAWMDLDNPETDPIALPELQRRLAQHLLYLSKDFQRKVLLDAGAGNSFDLQRALVTSASLDRCLFNSLADRYVPADDPRYLFSGARGTIERLTDLGALPNLFSWFSKRNSVDEYSWSQWVGMISSDDPTERIIGALFGAEYAPPTMYRFKCDATKPETRLAAVLTVGFRLTIPPVSATLPVEAPLTPHMKEEANTILFADEKEPIDLRKFGRVGNYTVAEHWKALKHTEEQEMLFSLLMERLEDTDDKVRLQAAHFLSLLNDPRSESKIAMVTANVQDKRLNLGRLDHLKPTVWMLGPVPDQNGFQTVHPVETTAIDLTGKYEIAGKSYEWKQTNITSPDRPLYDFRTLFGPSPNSSVYSFFRLDTPTAQRMQLLVGSEDGVKVWQNGKLVFENDVVRPLIQLDDVVSLNLQPGSNDILVRVRMREGLGGQYFHYKHLGDVKLTIPDKPDGLSLAERLKSSGTGSQPIDPKFLEVDWAQAIKQGDVTRGKKLFAAESLGCAKCHAATATQAGGGGPSLADAGKRFTVPYLVESVLAPNKVISPVFKSSVITTSDGKVITGLVVSETSDKLEVLQPDTKRISLNKNDVEERKLGDTSAMPHGIVKTPDELRDVLVYLLSNP
ncbi:MAG TPA: c-type cytochrome, partial [Schlesneria sp.]